ncbi:Ca-transporting ATPase [Clavulina sp. PMI_390]|nr:Ca-transporting ATPase [Clavulina sp. PMI_390]
MASSAADDFARLVSRANPAAARGQYAQPGNVQGPSATDYAMDPFFDDEDDSAAGPHYPQSMHTQGTLMDSVPDLPLRANAAPPAGVKPTASTIGLPQGWDFQDEPVALPQPAVASSSKAPRRSSRRKWKWPWSKEVQLEGEREIFLNDAPRNDAQSFMSNYVSTSKYNVATFVPKFLAEQFSKYANVFFLFTGVIQQIPGVSPTNPYTTVVPLGLVLLASAFKEVEEDMKRHQSDNELNSRMAQVLNTLTSQFELRKWKDIMVGDVVRLESDSFIPADLVLVSSSEPEGLCYIETSNLDGETNLKIKQASQQTFEWVTPQSMTSIRGKVRSEQPNNSLYTFEGTLALETPTGGFSGPSERTIPLGPDQLLLRGAQIRNTPWVYGIVVFTGHETKLMRNATAAPIKRTQVERQVNLQIVFLFIVLVAMSLGSTVGSSIRTWFYSASQWYLLDTSTVAGRVLIVHHFTDFLTFIILYNNLIPISLIVTMEVVKFQQAQFINSDLDMYYAPTDTPALCRTSSLVEELGQIEYIFSDKTGTLTQNLMEFRLCSIAGSEYAEARDNDSRDGLRTFAELRNLVAGGNPFADPGAIPNLVEGLSPAATSDPSRERDTLKEFLTVLAVCHTVIPEVKGEKIVYQASSPDEAALVQGAELLGYRFHTRKPKSVFVDVGGQNLEYQILNVCEFNSTRKRMSTVIRGPDGRIKLYCKGADTVILERLGPNQPYTEATLAHLEEYATEGLRTLCFAMREIPEAEYETWSAIYTQAASSINGRGEALDKAAEIIEKDMFLLGATAIEDKLQDGVPDAIHTLQQAGIKVWVLTGDRQETAINIGLSCRLISESMNLVIVNEENAHDTAEFITKRLNAIKSQRNSGELEDLALIIDGKSLTFALEKPLSSSFLELAIMCKAVICCRVSPLQKALVVKLVKKNQKSILLAIGDGANDVGMIQAAHVGVGISGVEGLQAARSADIAISQFRYLKKLLLVHGAWSYQRLSKLILYSFYKNITLYMTQFWYSFFNNFSGQVAYESWTLSLYNVVFSLLPPLVIGVFDQFVSARILDRYPQLYQLGQRNVFFTRSAFWQWIGNAVYHSLLLFGASLIMFWGDEELAGGYVAGHWVWGTILYMMVLFTVLGKAALVSDLWTKYTVAAIPGSLVFTMAFLPLYAIIAPAIGFSTEYQGIVPRMWTAPIFWFSILVFPVLSLARDVAWKYYRRTYRPMPYHIAQELQKYNIPDYRPRQEQFQKAIKKVRATQRMRRDRGFAFSQTEDSSRQDQARLIRAYDTSQSHHRPTGL